ncbi:uncharacterized protein DDB_G0271670 isoform X2 [Daphnia magna]|uniref:uncharacterized protein DDB_G0271670 isoform X2 n=1 Tax=Daphnia magna TaxID=35525 RepID=UPI001E1BB0D5|nr:uncharacterized protein DDB_G0271670 isoform X2 [Daphnia magna]
MRVVTSLEFGGARILQEFWMTLLKVLSRNKKKEPNEQGRQSRTANNKRDHLLMKKHLRHKRFQPFLPIPVTGEGKKKPLDLTAESVATAKAAGAAAAQRAERNLSVKRDLALDLPTCPTLPDGEEKPYGSSIRLRIRDHDQESEIYQECIRPPPNRTVHETSTSFPPFRCNSESILTERPSGSGRAGNSKTAGPSSSSSSSSSSSTHSQSSSSSSSSIMAVYCCTSASYSSSTSSLSSSSYGSSGGYGYRNLSGRPHHHNQQQKQQQQQQQQQQQKEQNSVDNKKDLFSIPAATATTRLLLDIHGQPIVTRSKSMSTGSSLQQPDGAPCPAGSSSSCNMLAVMVPLPPPLPSHQQQQQQQQPFSIPPAAAASKTLESAVKSCVRSFRDRVHPCPKMSSASAAAIGCSSQTATAGGVDNAGFVESTSGAGWPSATLAERQHHQDNNSTNNNNNYSRSTGEPSSGTSRSKLANLPVVPCASASTTTYSSSSSSTSSQTRRDI